MKDGKELREVPMKTRLTADKTRKVISQYRVRQVVLHLGCVDVVLTTKRFAVEYFKTMSTQPTTTCLTL